MSEERVKCNVLDGNFVEPCTSLSENTDNAFAAAGRAKGITRWTYWDTVDRVPSRTFFGVKTKARPDGFLFNFCPFCGEDISAPFMDKEQPPPTPEPEEQSSGGPPSLSA